ncbi:unnamed protein product, partial [Prorocentrum cordatum]
EKPLTHADRVGGFSPPWPRPWGPGARREGELVERCACAPVRPRRSCTRWGAEARVGVLAGRRAVAGKGHQLHQAAAHCVPDGWHLQGCHADGRDARTGRDGVAQQGFLLRRLGAQPDERVRGAQLRGRFLLRGPMVGEHGERQGALSA